jgi:hypothetical protein
VALLILASLSADLARQPLSALAIDAWPSARRVPESRDHATVEG